MLKKFEDRQNGENLLLNTEIKFLKIKLTF